MSVVKDCRSSQSTANHRNNKVEACSLSIRLVGSASATELV